jgi:hypothetical protein
MVFDRLLAYLRGHHVGLVALFIALGGSSFAAGVAVTSTGAVIHGCYRTKGGSLHIVAARKRCAHGERAITWSQQGPAGASGSTGAAGPPGVVGTPGSPGAPGAPGANFTAQTTLQSGQTESGTYSITGAFQTGEIEDAINFRIPLATATTHISFIAGSPSAQCPGPGQAAPGYLCLYNFAGTAGFLHVTDLFAGVSGQASPTGFLLQFDATGTGDYSLGTWAITAA